MGGPIVREAGVGRPGRGGGRAARGVRAARAAIALLAALGGVFGLPALARQAGGGEELYRDVDRFSSEEPPLVLERPNREWVFIDLERQRAALAAELPADLLQAQFRGLRARLHHPRTRATLSVYAHEGQQAAALEPEGLLERTLRAVRERPGVRVVEAAPLLLKGRPAAWVRFETEAAPVRGSGAPGGNYACVRVDCPLPDHRTLLILYFEVPAAGWPEVRRELRSILGRLAWRGGGGRAR
ncbi:MAG: hypothetical protein KatS3mg102_1973 [Planctomycetota bacterium]|nr:MAG: hypothetical protein KatS3mg102_1973 [Planctomycetota bacterium]